MEKDWNEIWRDFKGLNWSGNRSKKEQSKEMMDKMKLPRNTKAIDITLVNSGGKF
jgi:hypothetical protein